MDIKIYGKTMKDPIEMPVELVERKGLGHPDTLADMIAMSFSDLYSNYCLSRFGIIPNHWADKVTIVGGEAEIGYGFGVLKKPMKIFQFGRVTESIGNEKIDIQGLFQESVRDVMKRVFGSLYMDPAIECQAITHSSHGPDHPKEFYNPSSIDGLLSTKDLRSNDTVILTAYTPFTPLEKMVVEVENLLNSQDLKSRHPATGYDIKVLAARENDRVDLTCCIPFVGERTPDHNHYHEQLSQIREEILVFIKDYHFDIQLNLNTKDFGEYAYLTLFGTSCDKGGCGAVGRGNKYNGLIPVTREMAVEAPAGKNPTHHSGRLYSEALHIVSREIYKQWKIRNYVNLVSHNGDPLNDPSFIYVKGIDEIQNPDEVRELTQTILGKTSDLTMEVIKEDPVKAHASKPRELFP